MNDDADQVDVMPIDITPYKNGNTGVDFITTFDSGIPGPHAMVAAVTHGNEICGAHALDFLFRGNLRPTRGRLTLGFMNHAAYHNFDPANPRDSRFVDEDFNRVWDTATLDGPRNSAELERARQVRPVIDQVDVLLDIHSMLHATPPLCLAGPLVKGRELARGIGYPVHVMCDAGHAAGRRLRDYGAFGKEGDGRNALLIECGSHWAKSSVTVAREMAVRFLCHVDVIDPALAVRHLPSGSLLPQMVVEVSEAVTIQSDDFVFEQPFIGMEVIEKAGTLIARDGAAEVRVPYDNCILIMPNRRAKAGETAVRLGRFVD